MTNEPSIFTKIINREIPADIIYEDERVIAFLTIEPVNYGHALVVSKIPFANIFDGNNEELGYMMQIAARIGRVLVNQDIASGVNIIMNNGVDASQEVFHAHIHVVPRHAKDDAFQEPKHITPKPEETKRVAEILQSKLGL